MIDKRLVLALAPAAFLAACDNAAEETSAAPVEVIEGTISDAMLPIDQLRSQPPLEDADGSGAAGSGGERGEQAGGPGGEAGGEAPAEAEEEAAEPAEDAAEASAAASED